MKRIHQFWGHFEKPIFWRDALAGKPARGQQEARKKLARGQQEASQRPARGQQEARSGGALWRDALAGCSGGVLWRDALGSRQDASKMPGKSQQDASKRLARRGPKWGGPPRNTETIEKQAFS